MTAKQTGTWKKERASVNVAGKSRPRSNKYSKSDTKPKPSLASRSRVWVSGYDRADGSHVDGYYLAL